MRSEPLQSKPDEAGRRLLALLRDVLLAFLFPDSCVACAAPLPADRRHLCASCGSELFTRAGSLPMSEASGPREGASVQARVFYAFEFEGAVRAVIHALKYGGRTSIAGDLARLAAPAALRACVTPPDVVVPVPLHPVRFRERGFNQSEILAVHLAASLGAPARRALLRTRHAPPQARLPRRQRLAIAPGTFRVAEGIARPGRVLLIDDVATTGATLAAAALELLNAGAEQVVCFALAGTPPRDPAGRAGVTGRAYGNGVESG